MKKILFQLGVMTLVCVISCYPKEKSPKLNLEEEVIIKILTDLHIAQAVVKKFPVKQRDSINALYKHQICKVYNLESSEIDNLISTLEAYPDYFYEVNGKVLENIKELENAALNEDSRETERINELKK